MGIEYKKRIELEDGRAATPVALNMHRSFTSDGINLHCLYTGGGGLYAYNNR